jgi:hypothetical protein
VGSIAADLDKEKRDKDTNVEDAATRFAKYIMPIS